MNELTQNGAYPERTANGNLCRVILFKNFRCGLITARHVMDQATRIRPDGRAKLMTEPYQAHDRSP
jgi:hypothetical protein